MKVYIVTDWDNDVELTPEVMLVTTNRSKAVALAKELFTNHDVVDPDDYDEEDIDGELTIDEENGYFFYDGYDDVIIESAVIEKNLED